MEIYFSFLINLLGQWGFWAIVLGMALESACFPVPSEIVLPFAGFLVAQGSLSFSQAVFAGLLGGMLGSIAAYLFGRWGGRPLLSRFGGRFWLSPQHLQLADQWVVKYGESAAFWARFLPIVRTFISLPLGITQMSFSRFLLFSFAGSIPWTIVLIYGGRLLGENWTIIREYGDWLNLLIIAAVLTWGGLWWFRRQSRK